MKRSYKILLWIFSTLLLVFGGVVLYIYTNLGQIKAGALEKVNTYLSAPAKVENIDITFIHSFPKIELTLEHVYVKSPVKNTFHEELLGCKSISIGFDFWDIFNKKYKFKKIAVNDGNINIYTNKEGKYNYDIIKHDTSTSGSNADIFLKEVSFHHMQFHLVDDLHHMSAKAYIKNLVFSGNFKEKIYDMKLNTALKIEQIQSGSQNFTLQEEINISTKLSIDRVKKIYTIEEGKLTNDQLKCDLKGYINNEKSTFYNLSFNQEQCDLLYLSNLLPVAYKEKLSAYTAAGNITLHIDLKGAFTNTQKPVLSILSTLKNGSLQSPDKKVKATNLSFELQGSTQTDAYKKGYIQLKNVQANINQTQLKTQILLADFEHPYIEVDWLSQGKVSDISSFIPSQNLQVKTGEYTSDFKIKGKLEDIKEERYKNIEIERFLLQAHKLDLKIGNNSYTGISFQSELNNGHLNIQQMDFDFNHEPVQMKLEVQNFLPYIFTQAKPFVTCKINFDKIEVFPSNTNEKSTSDTVTYPIPEFDLKLVGREFKYNKHVIKNLTAAIGFKNELLQVAASRFDIYDGNVVLENLVYNSMNKEVVFSADIKEIDINKMFVGLENFKQNTLTDKHIRGIFSSKNIKGKIRLDKNYKPIYDEMILETDMVIKNGRLQNFEPIYMLSKFVKVEELKDIKFAELTNKISIHDNNIYIPDMQIVNNALNIQISGTHSFENILDYHFKILLKDLLVKKRKAKVGDEFGEYEEVTDKGVYLYLFLKGDIDHLKFGYDRKNAKQAFASKIKDEKEKVKQLFKKEVETLNDKKLNPSKKDTAEAPPEIKWDDGD